MDKKEKNVDIALIIAFVAKLILSIMKKVIIFIALATETATH